MSSSPAEIVATLLGALPREAAKLAGTLMEFEQVGRALFAVFQSAAKRQISGLFV